ncbi:MAG: chorismate synthase [Clostridiales bacterium]|nr:chorismate synthase [Clostridiales bacterium]
MSSEFGNALKLTVFGESHSAAIGAVIDGIPAGERVDLDEVALFMKRRAPGGNEYSTKRREKDEIKILSGIVNGVTTGTPIAAEIVNSDVRSSDYNDLKRLMRPSHADYPAFMKYGDAHDARGGGHFSGRLTAPLCFAGALSIQILRRMGVTVGAHALMIGKVRDVSFDSVNITPSELLEVTKKEYPVSDDGAADGMKEKISEASKSGDSVGGIVECCILGVKAGIGEPIFDGIENEISKAVFGIPAVKGIEFGAGFLSAEKKGSENNDEYYYDGETVKTRTNNAGGAAGGLSTGMPIIFRAAFKPTPSIAREQNTVDIIKKENAVLAVSGRHDPCIVFRAVPCVEAAAALSILNLIYMNKEKGM